METRSSTVRQAANNEPLVGITVPQGASEEEVQCYKWYC
jgi:hypothetical protein